MYEVTIANAANGEVHGHKAGCADLKRSKAYALHRDEQFTVEVETKREAWLDYNSDFIAEGGEGNAYPIEWMACAKHVPEGTEDAGSTADEAAPVDFTAEPVEQPGEAVLQTSWAVDERDDLVMLDLGDGQVFAFPKTTAQQLGAALAKTGKTTTVDADAAREAFAAKGTGIEAEEFVAAKAYSRTKGKDETGQGWTIYQYASGKTELVPLQAKGKQVEICTAWAKKHGGDVKPSGYIVL